MTVKVSIISAIYNSEKWLEECLESLVNQTLKDIEIILVNDASPDNSLDILKAYKNKHPNLIKLIDLKENTGGGGALNKGLEIAKGEYISFVDPDDYVDITMCEKLYAHAKRDNADILQFSYVKFDDGQVVDLSKPGVNSQSVATIPDSFFVDGKMQEGYKKDCILLQWKVGPHWSRFYRSSVFKGVKFPEGKYHDLPIIFLLILVASKITKTDEKLYYYRQRPGSICSSNNHKDSFNVHIERVEWTINECMRLGLYESYKDQIMYFMAEVVFSRLHMLFGHRGFYNSHSNIHKFLSALKQHLQKIEDIYPGYTDNIFDFCDKNDKRKVKLLFSHPSFLKLWLDVKFGAKNLFHKVF